MKIGRRIIFGCIYLLGIYFCYLVVLGPVAMLSHHGLLRWVPQNIRQAMSASVEPVEVIPKLGDMYHHYLKHWNGTGKAEF